MPTANDIRQQFLDFFKKHGHTIVPSSPVVPQDDPTLLFTNAGMNQFKDVFLGTGTRPYKRAADTQKCIRASGKHNDLEDVGRDTYHHTFFEMLGNWSFGDYYKAEAIRWAWELLTQVWGLDKSRLHATVFGGDKEFGLEADEEAAKLWTEVTDIDAAHVHRFGKKDNFWMMGETGPCGPCSEIHIDRTPDRSGGPLVNAGDARVMEIWNLVFIQYNRDDKGVLHLLPAKHVDTGMGFERICAVLQGKSSNYDTDVFTPLMAAIGAITGKSYAGKLDNLTDIAFRVLADHVRMATFAITDGALPSNKDRGSVLRSIIRRAVRFAWQCFDQREPLLYQLVPTVVAHMGAAFPELRSRFIRVADVIKTEEADFLRTIERGLSHFEDAATRAAGAAARISGKDVFALFTTYGFPPDMTRQMASERGFGLDEDAYAALMKEHERISRGSGATPPPAQVVQQQGVAPESGRVISMSGEALGNASATASASVKIDGLRDAIPAAAYARLDVNALPVTDDSPKYCFAPAPAKAIGWVAGDLYGREGVLETGCRFGVVTDRTNFYVEQGGQVGDTGSLVTETGNYAVQRVQRLGNTVVHWGQVTRGTIQIGQQATLNVDENRAYTMRNHTATHLLHWALDRVLGEHVEQRGSKVKPDEFTFDFSHTGPLTDVEKAEVERLVNEKVYADLPVGARELAQAEAKKLPGVKAFFGDKYGETVRVIEIGDGFSREFCGGTHLEHTGQIGYFKIVGEEAVGKGVRRLTCVTAREAVRAVQEEDAVLGELTGRFRCRPAELPAKVDALQEEIKRLQQQLKKGAATDLAGAADRLLATATEVGGAHVIVGELPAGPEEQLRSQIDRIKQKAGSAVVVVGWTDDGKVGLIAAATDDLVKRGVHAGKLVGEVAKVVGGGGGGRPTMAQAGGKDPAKLGEALAAARALVDKQLKK